VRNSPGAAGTVVNNLAALGAGTLYAIGGTGDDGQAYDLRKQLGIRRCDTSGLLPFDSLMTPTYLKPRDQTDPSLAGEHSRYDTRNRRPTPPEVTQRILEAVDAVLPKVDAVIIADQVEESDFGIITTAMRDALSERAVRYREVLFWADSRRNIRRFRNMHVKPNQFEAVGHTHPLPGEQIDFDRLDQAIVELRREIGGPVCITRGEQGSLVCDDQVGVVPGVHVSGPVDPTGAGDSFTAGAVLALSSDATLPEAALVGSLVASITVGQLATTSTATPGQLRAQLDLWREQNGD